VKVTARVENIDELTRTKTRTRAFAIAIVLFTAHHIGKVRLGGAHRSAAASFCIAACRIYRMA